ncbi:MAG: sigma-54 dependent transcriptional regulator [Gemmatimonadota bacterium]
MKILVVDDDPGLRKSLTMILKDAEYEVLTASAGEDGLRIAAAAQPDIILTDVRMPGMGGLEFLDAYKESRGDALVLVMTAYGSTDLAIDAMKRGAYDYLPKPFGADEVLLTVKKAMEREKLRREVGRLRAQVRADQRFGEIVARAPAMVRALEIATKVAPHPSPVLVTGPSGTGKELVARLIHQESERSEMAFLPVNCGAIPETLLESEFFGYVKGAFSGADRDKPGLFEAADKGTLFLDEVGELPASLQVKLLRALQEGEIRRVGGTESQRVDVRVISATNRNLREEVEKGNFREDLYYRLAVVPIYLPPLRERPEEIPDLVHFFIERHSERLKIPVTGVEPEAMEVLLKHTWPGNIRELENLLEQAMVLSDRPTLRAEDLPERLRRPESSGAPSTNSDLGDDLSVKRHTASLEKRLIQLALERTGGNRTHAAELLELSPRALRYKIRDYDLE